MSSTGISAVQEALQAGDYQRVIALSDSLIQSGQADKEVYFRRGLAGLHLGTFEDALQDCEQAVRLWPDNPNAVFNRGLCHKNLGNFAAARQDFEWFQNLYPDDPDVHQQLALCNPQSAPPPGTPGVDPENVTDAAEEKSQEHPFGWFASTDDHSAHAGLQGPQEKQERYCVKPRGCDHPDRDVPVCGHVSRKTKGQYGPWQDRRKYSVQDDHLPQRVIESSVEPLTGTQPKKLTGWQSSLLIS